eukprot:CAMPEP_0203671830 /NCGR_PEP_ID=MMETSP0090-20130426/7510_1 /ASSEMBLY_ACC=CAM_ASM_001088 /TAXON_ID=426623 /ORGANISM="Chaetoceros affinis, Strain CCMP159" /LENGTH=80 /DNA_ID=CAMNT_0050536993 /DNA_START=57 /DNA_END=296 /DNA_ORIENTATION=+
MSSSRLSQLIRHSKSLPIKLPQNSNLIIRTPSFLSSPSSLTGSAGTDTGIGEGQKQKLLKPPIRVNINIVPEWRDDGYIT